MLAFGETTESQRMSDIELAVEIKIDNKKEFEQSAVDYGCTADDPMEEMVKKIAIGPDESPEKHGYKITAVNVKSKSGRTHILTVGIDVLDEKKMIDEARNCYQSVWQDEDWKPETLGEASFELLCGSNERPSPDTMGFAYWTWSYPKDRAVNPEYVADPSDEEDEELDASPAM
jgi:hypothetical protein